MKQFLKYVYVIIFMLIGLIPLVLFSFLFVSDRDTNINIEKTKVAEFPQIIKDKHLNEAFDDECENWVNQNIPFRGMLISKWNVVLSDVLKMPTSNVVAGKDGWIYSSETIADYMDTNAMPDEEVKAIGVTLSLVQEKVEASGGKFLFVPVPNKNSIYSEYMPIRYQKASNHNLTRICEELEAVDVNYLDLTNDLQAAKEKNEDQRYYYKRDTHWTPLGAMVGYQSIMNKLGKRAAFSQKPDYSTKTCRISDLDKLLFPTSQRLDEEYIINDEVDYDGFEFINPVGVDNTKEQLLDFMSDRENHDNDFTTRRLDDSEESSLYMVRDSFARALLPYMITSYGKARFVRSASPSFENLTKGADVIYEICERNLKNLSKESPVMYAPKRTDYQTTILQSKSNKCDCEDEGYAYKVYGTVDSKMIGEDGRIYVRVVDSQKKTMLFEAFPIYQDGFKFSAYIDKSVVGDAIYDIVIVSGKNDSGIVAKLSPDSMKQNNEADQTEAVENPFSDENAKHQIVLRGVTIGIGDNINALKGKLGNQTEPSETIYSCLSGKDALLYHYPDVTLETDMDGRIYYISLMDDGLINEADVARTESGIVIGSDKMDIWKKLGKPTRENDKNCYYQTEHIKITYSYQLGKITSVILEERNGKLNVEDSFEETQSAPGIEYENGNTYLYNDEHLVKTGWQIVDGEYYFFDRATGERIVGATVDGIEIGEDGKVSPSDYEKKKIETMMKAHDIVLENTSPTDSMEEKRKKVFDWILSFPYYRHRHIKDVYKQEGIEIIEANDIFDAGSGDCVSESAALAFLFHEIGYENVYWVHDTGHSWVRCEDRLFDPLFAEARDYNANYNVPFTDYRKSMAHSLLIY